MNTKRIYSSVRSPQKKKKGMAFTIFAVTRQRDERSSLHWKKYHLWFYLFMGGFYILVCAIGCYQHFSKTETFPNSNYFSEPWQIYILQGMYLGIAIITMIWMGLTFRLLDDDQWSWMTRDRFKKYIFRDERDPEDIEPGYFARRASELALAATKTQIGLNQLALDHTIRANRSFNTPEHPDQIS